MCIPLKDELAAERRLQSLLYSTPKEEDAPLMPKGSLSNVSLDWNKQEDVYKRQPLSQ